MNSPSNRYKDLVNEAVRLRSLQSHFSHDLRSEIGRSLSSVRLLTEDSMSPEDKLELVKMAQESLEKLIEDFDSSLEMWGPQVEHVFWVGSSTGSELAALQAVPNLVVHCYATLEEAAAARRMFRPDYLVVEQLGTTVAEGLVEGIQSICGGMSPAMVVFSSEINGSDGPEFVAPMVKALLREPGQDLGSKLSQWIVEVRKNSAAS